MGMFDRLYVSCPECHEDVEFQSKAGECLLESYDVVDVPVAIAIDLDGETSTCECGHMITLRVKAIALIDIS